ncbi:DUF6318 family protein [Geodermatophilus sp. SYSU D00079]
MSGRIGDQLGVDVTRRWRLRLCAGLAMAAALLSGCSEERPAADTLPSASAVPSPTEDALPPLGPADMPMPDEARTQDAAGAEAFVRYYIDLINRTSTVMDAAPLREFSEGCMGCARIANDNESDLSAGYRYEGGELRILQLGEPLVHGTTAELAFRVEQAPLTVVNETQQPVPGLVFDYKPNVLSSASFRWDGQQHSWLMTQLSFGA